MIMAFNRWAAVIGRCLSALQNQEGVDHLDVVVVANGCSDDTAAVAERAGVTVIVLPEPGKSAALVVGDAAAVGFPRVYLDADIELPVAALGSRMSEAGLHHLPVVDADGRLVGIVSQTDLVPALLADADGPEGAGRAHATAEPALA